MEVFESHPTPLLAPRCLAKLWTDARKEAKHGKYNEAI
jgi:hypothetical protein